MQITLNQAEIEAAVRRAINEKVTIGEEVAIVLEDGPNGFTATADLDSEEDRATKPAVKPRAPWGSKKAAKATDPVQEKLPLEAAATETAQDAQEEAVADPTTVVETEAAAAPEGTIPAASDAAETEAVDEPIPDKPKSLFAGLAKPKNS